MRSLPVHNPIVHYNYIKEFILQTAIAYFLPFRQLICLAKNALGSFSSDNTSPIFTPNLSSKAACISVSTCLVSSHTAVALPSTEVMLSHLHTCDLNDKYSTGHDISGVRHCHHIWSCCVSPDTDARLPKLNLKCGRKIKGFIFDSLNVNIHIYLGWYVQRESYV